MYLYVVSMLFLGYTFYHLRIAKRDKDGKFKIGYCVYFLVYD